MIQLLKKQQTVLFPVDPKRESRKFMQGASVPVCVCVYGVWVWVCVFEVGEGVLGLSLVILRSTNFQYTDPPF